MMPRVLIAEESLPYRRVLREALVSFCGCEVDDTPSAETAFEMAMRRSYSLFLFSLPLTPFPGDLLDRLLVTAYPLAHPGRAAAPPVIFLLRPDETHRAPELTRQARMRGHLVIPPKLDALFRLTAPILGSSPGATLPGPPVDSPPPPPEVFSDPFAPLPPLAPEPTPPP
jgi:hypothetical protein